MSRGYRLAGWMLCLCAAALSVSVLRAQPNSCQVSWLDPVELSFDTILSTSPAFARDGDTVHVIWFGDVTLTGPDPHDGIQYVRSTDGGINFSAARRLVSFDSCLGAPGFLAGAGARLYVTYLAPLDSAPYYGTAVIMSSDGGLSWSSPLPLLSGVTPRIIAAEDSVICIDYQNPFTHSSGIIRSTNSGGSWKIASSNSPILNDFTFRNGVLHAVTSEIDILQEEVAYYMSTNEGTSWIGPTYVSNEDAVPSLEPKLAVDPGGTISVVWNDTGSIVYRHSEGVNEEGDIVWSTPEVLSSGRGAIFADVAATGPFVSVVWDTEVGQQHGIRMRQSNSSGASFCATDTPTASIAAVEPVLGIRGTTLLLVWSEVTAAGSEIISRRGILQRDLWPKLFSLQQNYPNPFNGSTEIGYDLPSLELVNLSVYNLLGQRVATLVDGVQTPAHYVVNLDASRFPSGVYFYRLRTWHFIETKKMVVVR